MWLAAEDVISRLLPSQQLYAADQAHAANSMNVTEPTAAATAEQMFGHHPALWASHASPSPSSHQSTVPEPLHAAPVYTELQSDTGQSDVKKMQQQRPIAMNNILPMHHRLIRSGIEQVNSAAPHKDITTTASSSSSISRLCDGKTAQFPLTVCHTIGSSVCSTAQPACSNSVTNTEHQPQHNTAVADDSSLGFWRCTVQLARLVSFPLRMSRAYNSYVPVGQQLYLEPQAISSTLRPPPPQPDAASTSAETLIQQARELTHVAGEHSAASSSSSSSSSNNIDVVVQRRKELLGRLWMHRMPIYRARMQQILYGALGLAIPEASLLWEPLIQPAPAGKAMPAAVQSAGSHVAPQVEVLRAEIAACALLGSNHFKQAFKVCHCRGLVDQVPA